MLNLNEDPFLHVKSRVLEYVHKNGFNCSELVYCGEKLNQKIKAILDNGMERAKGNFRKTLMERDL